MLYFAYTITNSVILYVTIRINYTRKIDPRNRVAGWRILYSLCKAVLQIRIHMDPELLPGSGFRIIVPDPAKIERAEKN